MLSIFCFDIDIVVFLILLGRVVAMTPLFSKHFLFLALSSPGCNKLFAIIILSLLSFMFFSINNNMEWSEHIDTDMSQLLEIGTYGLDVHKAIVAAPTLLLIF